MNRRKFLGGAVLAGAALAVPGAVKALGQLRKGWGPLPEYSYKYKLGNDGHHECYVGPDWIIQPGDTYTIEGLKNPDGKLTRFIVTA